MPAHAHARRRWRRLLRPAGRSRVRVWVRVRVLYPTWFFLNRVSRVWVTRSVPAPLSASELPRQRLSVNRRDGWTEPSQRFRPNRCNYWLGSDGNTPPGAL